jgi:hypothetical protein
MGYSIEQAARVMNCPPELVTKLLENKYLRLNPDGQINEGDCAAVLKSSYIMSKMRSLRSEIAAEQESEAQQNRAKQDRVAKTVQHLKSAVSGRHYEMVEELVGELAEVFSPTSESENESDINTGDE